MIYPRKQPFPGVFSLPDSKNLVHCLFRQHGGTAQHITAGNTAFRHIGTGDSLFAGSGQKHGGADAVGHRSAGQAVREVLTVGRHHPAGILEELFGNRHRGLIPGGAQARSARKCPWGAIRIPKALHGLPLSQKSNRFLTAPLTRGAFCV